VFGLALQFALAVGVPALVAGAGQRCGLGAGQALEAAGLGAVRGGARERVVLVL